MSLCSDVVGPRFNPPGMSDGAGAVGRRRGDFGTEN